MVAHKTTVSGGPVLLGRGEVILHVTTSPEERRLVLARAFPLVKSLLYFLAGTFPIAVAVSVALVAMTDAMPLCGFTHS